MFLNTFKNFVKLFVGFLLIFQLFQFHALILSNNAASFAINLRISTKVRIILTLALIATSL